jgi:hypothetical protein
MENLVGTVSTGLEGMWLIGYITDHVCCSQKNQNFAFKMQNAASCIEMQHHAKNKNKRPSFAEKMRQVTEIIWNVIF